MQFALWFNHPGKKVPRALQVTKLLRTVRDGGRTHVEFPDGVVAGEFKVDVNHLPNLQTLEAWERLLTVLAEIQPKVAKYGQFSLTSSFTGRELQTAEQVRAMCSRASWETRMSLAANMGAPPPSPDGLLPGRPMTDSVEIMTDSFKDVVLFGVRVPVGRVRVVFKDGANVKAAIARAHADQSNQLKIVDAPVLLKYLEWEPPLTGPKFKELERSTNPKKGSEPKGRGRNTRES